MKLLQHNAILRARINRYIVGCKYISKIGNGTVTGGINRYIVGCKYRKL